MSVNFVERIEDRVAVRNVIVSVSDKQGLGEFVAGLCEAAEGARFYSTGGTYKALEGVLGAGSDRLVSVSDYTGQPEMQGGLVKTLDFKIYLGLLSESFNEAHDADLARTGAVRFDMVVANLYPFRETVAREEATPEMARANIDIGGPCMVRASAKNFLRVAVVTSPSRYGWVLDRLREGAGALDLETRFELAREAFAHTAGYDAAIRAYLDGLPPEAVSATYRKEK